MRNGEEGVSPEEDRDNGGVAPTEEPGCNIKGLKFGDRGVRLVKRSGDSGVCGVARGPSVGEGCCRSLVRAAASGPSEYGEKGKVEGIGTRVGGGGIVEGRGTKRG